MIRAVRPLSVRSLALPAIVIAYTVLGLVYSFASPIFEAPDESYHYFVVQYIRETGDLPVQNASPNALYAQEGSQAPLYYWLGAAATSWIDVSRARDFIRKNPQANIGRPGSPGNKNHFIHTAREAWPYHETPLAVHVLRWMSIGLGIITLGFTYATARSLFADRSGLALLATALVAFNPQFVYLSASVNNDNAINVMAAAGLYLLARAWRGDRSWANTLALGVIIALAVLSKLSGLILLGFALMVIVYLSATRRAWRWGVRVSVVIVLAALALTGWWFLRNYQLYGDLTGTNVHIEALGTPRMVTAAKIISELPSLWFSSWGVFGWFNMQLPDPIFGLYAALVVGAIMAGVLTVIRVRRFTRSQIEPIIGLLVWLLLAFVGVLRWELLTMAFQGRLMFTAIGAMATLIAAGWQTLLGRWRASGAIAIGMFGVALWTPFGVIAPAYALPDHIQLSAVPSSVNRLNVDFNHMIRLIGGAVEPRDVQPGDTITIQLYWQALQKPDRDYMVFVHLLGRSLELVGNEDAYHGAGTFPSDLWQAGDVIADQYLVRISDKADAPARVRVEVGLRDRTTKRVVSVTDSDGIEQTDLVIVDQFRLGSGRPIGAPQQAVTFRVGDAIELIGYDAPQIDRANHAIKYRLYWHVLKPINEDYTEFAHLLDAHGALIGQGDSEPFNGDYPTSWWRAGDTFVEERLIRAANGDVPAGSLLEIGLYQLDNGVRLPVLDASGNVMPNGRIVLNLITDIRRQK